MDTVHQPAQTLHQIMNKKETSGLAAAAIKGERFTAQGLHDEVAHHRGATRISAPCMVGWSVCERAQKKNA